MEDSINKRFSLFVSTQKINEPETYKALGTRRQVWFNWISDIDPIPLKKIQSIISMFPSLNARWLLTGEGEMLNENNESKTYSIEAIKSTANEPTVTCFGCKDCIEKERTIQAQRKTIETQEKLITALETGHGKNGKAI